MTSNENRSRRSFCPFGPDFPLFHSDKGEAMARLADPLGHEPARHRIREATRCVR